MQTKIYPSKLCGQYVPVQSKSMMHRALICGSFCTTESSIIKPLLSDDIRKTMQILQDLGINIKINNESLTITHLQFFHIWILYHVLFNNSSNIPFFAHFPIFHSKTLSALLMSYLLLHCLESSHLSCHYTLAHLSQLPCESCPQFHHLHTLPNWWKTII